MSKSGITRRIDELGRIVVPKEIRYNLGIRDGEPLEIYTSDNQIIIKKYSQVENIKDTSQNICNIIYDSCNLSIIITDREKVIATSSNLKEMQDKKLDDYFKNLIDDRENYISTNKDIKLGINAYFTILPIITSIDCSGLVIILSETNENNLKYAKIVQKLLIQKLDIV